MLTVPYPSESGYPQLQPRLPPQMQARNRIAMQLMGRPQGGIRPATVPAQPVRSMPPLAAPAPPQLQQQMQPYGTALANYFNPGGA
jgi:hypothetical protein